MTSRKEKVGSKGFADTKFSSGDCNKTWKCKQTVEENNNEVDGLSKELQMGCIVDAVRRPPNICVETCVYDGTDTESEGGQEADEEDIYYTDDFEEDSSGEDGTVHIQAKTTKSETTNRPEVSDLKLAKSHSFTSTKPSISGKSGRSSHYGSLPVPQTRRVNMSFSNDRLREIERHNHILLNKILTARINKKSSIPSPAPEPRRAPPPPPAALNRKKQQKVINHENMILLRKIQRAKSSACSIRR